MILVDTSVWIDHLHRAEPDLVALLDEADVCVHPMVVGELALGTLRQRAVVLSLLADLPTVAVAGHAEVMRLVEVRSLYGHGLSLVDAHLLASALLTPGTRIWTRDRRLLASAQRLGLRCGPVPR